MKCILVTGGAGFIGFNLSKKLLIKNNIIISLDNFTTSTDKNIKKIKNKNYFFFKHDIVKPIVFLNKKFPKIDEIYHLACPTGVSNLTTLSEEMLLTCSVGTRNVLELARKTKAKLIFTSSSEVYGDPEIFPQSEEYTGNVDPIGIRSPYEEGKRFAESLVMAYVRKYNVDARIARVFNTYGQCISDKDSRVIPKFLRQIKTLEPLTVEGNGLQIRTFCYVDDLVDGLILVLNKGLTGEVYNIGSDKEIHIIDLAKLIIKITKSKSKIKFVKRPTHDHKRRLPDLAKIKKLGWRSNIDLKIGILRTNKWSKS